MVFVEVVICWSVIVVVKLMFGVIGSREMCFGEFCKGMMLFMSYFLCSVCIVYGYRYFVFDGLILL